MRLIDADELIERLSGKGANDLDLFLNERMVYLLNKEPTAYDPDKVVEQLEEASYWTDPTYDEDGYPYGDEIEVIDLSDAIEIVKGGQNE